MDNAGSASEILVERRGALGLLTLNRPAALNALTEGMVDAIQAALDDFQVDRAIRHVAIRGAGAKAFCAGGDIRQIYDFGKAGQQSRALDFWAREYRLNAFIHRYPKPYIALIDGIVMGGGVGVSLHGSHRLAGPNYLFAMPEVGIGFFPDVGATYALPRLPGAVGAYLAITGARIRRADSLALGLATHAIRGGCEADCLEALAAGEPIDSLARSLSEDPGEAPILAQMPSIERHFSLGSIPAIMASLAEAATDAEDPFATTTLAGMTRKSPMSMAIALEQMKRGRSLTFDAAMVTEFRIVNRIIYGSDFYEGVRAVIIDKDNAPHWSPAQVEDVSEVAVAEHFAPLDRDLDLLDV